jgi:GntR family transcriptional repressor for pyruvate dehydrogenase complex
MEYELLSKQVAYQIKRLILEGEYKEGQLLPSERDLCRQFGVSRTVIREALNLVKASNMIRVQPGKGALVVKTQENVLESSLLQAGISTPKLYQALIEARTLLEPVIAGDAAENATQEDIQQLELEVHSMRSSIANPRQYAIHDNAFHVKLAGATHNHFYPLVLFSIIDLLQQSMFEAVKTPGAVDRSLSYHENVLTAIKTRDTSRASELMNEHIAQASGELISEVSAR